MHSDGKSGLRSYNLDFGFAVKREIRKRISTLITLSLDFISAFFRWRNPKKGLNCCSVDQRSRTRAHNYQKKDHCSRELFSKSFFFLGFPNQTVEMEIRVRFLNLNLSSRRIA